MSSQVESPPLRVGSVCSGIGGLDLAFSMSGFEFAWHAEVDDYASKVLEKRWPGVENLGDWTTDAALERVVELNANAPIDLLVGGIPCQGNSVAGSRKGVDDERNLAPAFFRLVETLRPRMFLIENVPGILSASNGDMMAMVLQLADELGYSTEWDIMSAAAAGAPHRRERVFIVGRNDGGRSWERREIEPLFPMRPQEWPRAGRWENGTLFEREREWPTPKEVEGTATWPTPRAITGGGESGSRKAELGRTESGGGDLQSAVEMHNWPTPRAGDAKQSPASTEARRRSGSSDVMLTDVVETAGKFCPTPVSSLHNDGEDPQAFVERPHREGREQETGTGCMPLTIAARLWPTTSAMDGARVGKELDPEHWMKAAERHAAKGVNKHLHLDIAVQFWLTTTAGDAKDAGSRNTEGSAAHAGTSLTDAVLNGSETGRDEGQVDKGRLAPDWSECLMGLPVGWTDLECEVPELRPYPLPMACGESWGTPTSRDWKDGACADADVPTNHLLGRQVVRPLFGASPQAPWEPSRLVLPAKGDNRRHRLRGIGNAVELGTGLCVIARTNWSPHE